MRAKEVILDKRMMAERSLMNAGFNYSGRSGCCGFVKHRWTKDSWTIKVVGGQAKLYFFSSSYSNYVHLEKIEELISKAV